MTPSTGDDSSLQGARLVIAGGGTGGHLFPGLAVAQEWERRGGEVLFVGTPLGLEARLLPKLGRRLELLTVGKLKGSGPLERVRTLAGLPWGVVRAVGILHRFRPRVVLGVGGYAAAPAVVAAWLLGIPAALHEQNARPGITNRGLSRLIRLACLTYPEAAEWFSCPTRLTGNPVRAEFARAVAAGGEVARQAAPVGKNGLHILIFGGSQGARVLSTVVPEALAAVRDAGRELTIHQQARSEEVDSLLLRYRELGLAAEVVSFIDDMATAYRRADLVICRAGATSIAELAMVGKPALLIPYPFAADDHQTANARVVEASGAGWMRRQEEFTAPWLSGFLRELFDHPERLREAAFNMASLGRPRAAAEIVTELERMVTAHVR